MQSKSIFRQVALDRLSSPEQLDQVVTITSPKSWLALLALLILLGAAIIWSVVGQIPVEVSGTAILLNKGGVKNIVSLEQGQVTAVYIEQGQVVEAGQLIAEVTPLQGGEVKPVYTPFDGRILELKADVGTLISQGIPVASLEFVGESIDTEVVMYVSPLDGKQIKPGMLARIAPVTTQVEEHGYLLGRVTDVSDFPATYAGMLRILGSEELIRALGVTSAPIEVHISLLPDTDAPSGYLWSSSEGPDFAVSSGTLAATTVTVDRQRPINLVLPLK